MHNFRVIYRNILSYFGSQNEKEKILYIFSFGFLVRIYILFHTYVISNDGTILIQMAREFYNGNISASLDYHQSPLYPFLIAMFGPVTGDWVLAGQIISLLSGSLAIFPFYYLGKELFGPRIAIFSSLLFAIQPYAVWYSGDVLKEELYIFLFLIALLTGWLGLNRGKIKYFFISGTFCTLSYLTRIEGILAWTIIAFMTLIRTFYGPRRNLSRRFISFLVFLVPPFILLSFYISYFHSANSSFFMFFKYQGLVKSEFQNIKAIFSDHGSKEETSSEKINSMDKGAQILKEFLNAASKGRRFFEIMGYLLWKFIDTYHQLFFFLLIFGVIGRNTTGFKMRELYPLVFVLFYLLLFGLWLGRGSSLSHYPVSKRFILPLCLISLYWAGIGIDEIKERLRGWNWLKGRFPSLQYPSTIYAVIFMVILTVVLPKTLYPQRFTKIGIKEAGLWFKANNIKTPNILSDIPRVAFYADGKNFNFIDYGIKNYWMMVHFMLENNINYLVIEDNSIKEIIPDFFKDLKNTDFTLLWEYREKDNDKIFIYRINKFSGKVNLNKASIQEISLIPGIDMDLAKKIVEYKNKQGNFNNPEDLLKVPGMVLEEFDSPWARFNSFKKFITFTGETDFRIESRSGG